MTTKELSIDDIRERIISTEKVAHVTFYIVKEAVKGEDYYFVYSESKKSGLRLVSSQSFEYQQNDTGSYEDALVILRGEIQRLEEILERKRKGPPTQKQVYFLFCEKIPIPLDLTWGQASDLIDERLSQKEYEKEVRQQALLAKFNGFTVGMHIFQPRTVSGKIHIATGKITKLTSNKNGVRYAYVQWESENYTSRVTIDELYKTQDEAKSVQQFTAGDRAQHSMFGPGVILSSVISQGRELVCIRFDKPVLADGKTEGNFFVNPRKNLQKMGNDGEGEK